jgi:hypothetical protein
MLWKKFSSATEEDWAIFVSKYHGLGASIQSSYELQVCLTFNKEWVFCCNLLLTYYDTFFLRESLKGQSHEKSLRDYSFKWQVRSKLKFANSF